MKIPEQIIRSGLDEELLQYIKYLGIYKGYEAYQFVIPNAITGLPIVYLLRDNNVLRVFGGEAFDIINSFFKD